MGTLVPQTSNNQIGAYAGDDNPWADAARDVEQSDYLKFNGNTGEITFGAEDEPLPEGSHLICDMFNMERGWTCWVESEVADEVYVKITDGKPPLEHTLKQYDVDDEDDGWREGIKIPMIIEQYGNDPDDEVVGTRLLFNSTTGGVVRSAKKLSGAFGKAFRQHPNALPVCEVTVDSYIPKNKKHGTKYSLIFKIIGWMGADEIAELVGDLNDENDGEYEDEAPALEEPVKKDKTVREPEPEPEPEEVVEEIEDEVEEVAPAAPRRRRAAPAPEPDTDEDEVEETPPAPARRRRSTASQEEAAPKEDAPAEQAPRRRRAAPVASKDDQQEAPAPRGRSPQRGGRRARTFTGE